MVFRKTKTLSEEQVKNIERMNEIDAKQSKYIKNAEKMIIDWAKENDTVIYAFHYITGFGKDIQIYFFYKTVFELKRNYANGKVEETKQEFMRILEEIGYITEFNDVVRFEFDSDENVKKNYQGNYFLRLR